MQDSSHKPPRPPESGTPEANPKATLGALALSVIIHGTALVLVGGYVIFEGVIPKTPFVSVDIPLGQDLEEVVMPEPEELETMPETPDTPLALESTAQVSPDNSTRESAQDLVVASVASPVFNLPAVSAAPTVNMGTVPSMGQPKSAEQASATASKALRSMASFFGSQGEAQALVGQFYDFSRDRDGKPVKAQFDVYKQFVQALPNPERFLARFWKAPAPLSANYIAVPPLLTRQAFESFGSKPQDGTENPPFLAHYVAQVTPPASGRYRFAGFADNWLIVSVDGEVVLMGDNEMAADATPQPAKKSTKKEIGWESPEDLVYLMPAFKGYNVRLTYGDWIKWDAGDYKRVDILIGDFGGEFQGALFVQKEGVDYGTLDRNKAVPVLPLFRLTDERDKLGALQKFRLPMEEARGNRQIIFQPK